MSGKKLKVLIAPLHWGIGHATRCIPIIDQYIKAGYEVHIASDGSALQILINRYPDLTFHLLAPLNIMYGEHFMLRMFLQFPKLATWYRKDKLAFDKILKKENYDLIISDSRPAIHSYKIRSIILIHQLSPIIPWYTGGLLLKNLFHSFIKKYNEIWIPDLASKILSGKLSDFQDETKCRYIGFLSQINPINNIVPIRGNILAIVSGPEPLRNSFENKLKELLPQENVLIVGGRLAGDGHDIRYVSYLEAESLSAKIAEAEYIVTRGGYSTLMDLAPLGKKLILVPTPGQTEQEYLANRLVNKNMAVIWDIEKESWTNALNKAYRVEPFKIQNDIKLFTLE